MIIKLLIPVWFYYLVHFLEDSPAQEKMYFFNIHQIKYLRQKLSNTETVILITPPNFYTSIIFYCNKETGKKYQYLDIFSLLLLLSNLNTTVKLRPWNVGDTWNITQLSVLQTVNIVVFRDGSQMKVTFASFLGVACFT